MLRFCFVDIGVNRDELLDRLQTGWFVLGPIFPSTMSEKLHDEQLGSSMKGSIDCAGLEQRDSCESNKLWKDK